MSRKKDIDLDLTGFAELFMNDEGRAESRLPRIYDIPLSEIDDFPNHPFKVKMDEDMNQLVQSVKERGIITPVTLRQKEDGRYEIVSGHRRRKACELAGLERVPAEIKELSRDEAIILMVESNLQRSIILPSEKAKAYKMKYEAMKHQGRKSGKNTLDEVGEAAGENAKKVQRYIWLARLSDTLLEMVDTKRLGFSQGVDISFLSEEAQQWVEVVMEDTKCSVNMVQSAKLKEYGKNGELTMAMVRLILSEEKPKERKVTIKADKIREYFADDYSSEDIENIIIQLLDEWKQ